MSHVHLLITGEAGHGKDTIANYLSDKLGYKNVAFADLQKDEVVSSYSVSCEPVDLAWLCVRETKETPDARLSLQYCSDKNFVKVALKTYSDEDKLLFTLLKSGKKSALDGTVWANLSEELQNYVRDNLSFNDADRLKIPRSPRRITQAWGTEYRRLSEHGHEFYWIDPIDSLSKTSEDPFSVTDGRTHNEVQWGKDAGLLRVHVIRPNHGKKVAKHVTEMIPEPDSDTLVITNDKGLPELIEKIESDVIPQINLLKKVARRRLSLK